MEKEDLTIRRRVLPKEKIKEITKTETDLSKRTNLNPKER